MNWENIGMLSSIITIFGFCITLATAVLLFYQCQLLKSSLRTQSFQNMFNNIINIDMYFANNPKMKQYVYGDKMLPEDSESLEYAQAMSACELLLDHFEEVYGCKRIMSSAMWNGWTLYMNKVFQESDTLKHYIAQNKDKYLHVFVAVLEAEPMGQ